MDAYFCFNEVDLTGDDSDCVNKLISVFVFVCPLIWDKTVALEDLQTNFRHVIAH